MNKENRDAKVLLQVNQLIKEYQSGDETLTILDGVSMALSAGQTLSITGASGSGKSTLLNMISGFDFPTAGNVYIDEKEISALDEKQSAGFRNRVLGMVFQSHHLLREFTLLENIAMPALIAGLSAAEARKRAQQLLEKVGIAGRAQHYPAAVSGGERQRAAVARALINEPRLLLADEPTGNLDEQHSADLQQLLFDIVQDSNAALVLVTHDLAFASRADRRLQLQHGRLEEL